MQTISFALVNTEGTWLDASDALIHLPPNLKDETLILKLKQAISQLAGHVDTFKPTSRLIDSLIEHGTGYEFVKILSEGDTTSSMEEHVVIVAINYKQVIIREWGEECVVDWLEKKQQSRQNPRPWVYGGTQQPEPHQMYFERPLTIKPSPRQLAELLAKDGHATTRPELDDDEPPIEVESEEAAVTPPPLCDTPSWDTANLWMALAWPYIVNDLRVQGFDNCDDKVGMALKPSCPNPSCQHGFAHTIFDCLRDFEQGDEELATLLPPIDAFVDGLAGLIVLGDCFIHKSFQLAIQQQQQQQKEVQQMEDVQQQSIVRMHRHAALVAFVSQPESVTSSGKGVVKAISDYMDRLGVTKCILVSQTPFTPEAKKYALQCAPDMTITLGQYHSQYTFDWWNHCINQPIVPIYMTQETTNGQEPFRTTTFEQSHEVASKVLGNLLEGATALPKVLTNAVLATRYGLKPGDLLHSQRYYPKTTKMIRIACAHKEKKK